MTSIAPGPRLDTAAVLDALMRGRRSCRAFLPDPVPHELIGQVLETAQSAPSWCNTQPWQVIVTEGEATERFRAGLVATASDPEVTPTPDVTMPERYTGVFLDRRRESGWQLYEAVGIARGDRAASRRQALRNFEFFGAPHAAVVTVDAGLGQYAILDAGVHLGALLLTLESVGLGAVPQAALAVHSRFVREFFDIPEDRAVLVGMSFGWPDREHPANGYRTSRAALSDVVTWVDA